LVAYAVFLTNTSAKVQHRACLFSLYTNENYRNQGIADSLVKAVIAHLKPDIHQLHLSVITSNHSAIHLYEKNGFKSYGIEPRSFKIDEQFYDEQLLVLMFK
jgi:ribosomal protein S18 acetylase RimI-like enzyme